MNRKSVSELTDDELDELYADLEYWQNCAARVERIALRFDAESLRHWHAWQHARLRADLWRYLASGIRPDKDMDEEFRNQLAMELTYRKEGLENGQH